MIAEAIRRVVERQDLGREEMHAVFSEMMDGGASDVQKAALLVALRMKGETAEEITGAALAMRERVTPLDVDRNGLVDTCGTGGDGRGTFNVSTLAALVAAGAGAIVAKHGNRAVSSACGSADLLSALGVDIELDARQMSSVLRRVGIAFLFAPRLHPAMKAVVGVRRELGIRTIFNVLGPLTNPAFARRQVIGVYSDHLVEVIGRVLLALEAEHALVVHSRDGLDEISVSAPTRICEVRDGGMRVFQLEPGQLGLPTHSIEDVAGGDAAMNARIAREVLGGGDGAARDIVIANAGAALYVAGAAPTLLDGAALARHALASGAAKAKLDELVSASRSAA
ncbi:MAG TPA: anthranilate phosphoribosyltransferase [Thermoanaerobaculia bacterium]|jgi:anthranilate phosphoribosyltransferase|nr:anthranilate phosphoribosyltransferase [Thermoanaerobaculia bacterium]